MREHKHSGGRPPIYSYPKDIGEVTVNIAADKKQAKRIMSNASARAKCFRIVYRCTYHEGRVYIRRAA